MICTHCSVAQKTLNVENKCEYCDNDHMILLCNPRNKPRISEMLIYHSSTAIWLNPNSCMDRVLRELPESRQFVYFNAPTHNDTGLAHSVAIKDLPIPLKQTIQDFSLHNMDNDHWHTAVNLCIFTYKQHGRLQLDGVILLLLNKMRVRSVLFHLGLGTEHVASIYPITFLQTKHA